MLQQLTIDDFESLYGLMEESFPPEEHRTKEDQRALFSDPAYRVVGLRDSVTQRVIAFLAMWDLDHMLFLEHFAVSPALRGQGLGTKILAEVTASATKTVCLEVEPPMSDITCRRIAFYKRCGFFLNEYRYIQPSMAAGQPPVRLMVMTYGKSLEKPAFNRIRDELYQKIYHVPTMTAEESSCFDEMVKLAEDALQKAPNSAHTQAIVWRGLDGSFGAWRIENACSPDEKEESALIQALTAQTNGRISHLLCMWQDGSIDLPSHRLRKKLTELHPDNAVANVFVLTGGGYQARVLGKA